MRKRLSRRHRRWLYLCGSLLFGSGAGWLICHYFLRAAELISEGAPHPSEVWWMRIHGASLQGFLITFGALLPGHVIHGWRRKMNRATGVAMIIVVATLAITGYGLYYASGDTLRRWLSVMHWNLGLVSLAAFLWHMVRGRSQSDRAHEHLRAGRLSRPGGRPPG